MNLQTMNNNYKSSNFTLTVSPDLKRVSAWSYAWWQFIATDTVGNIFFNNYSYSNSTSQHQSNAASVLRRLGISIAVEVRHTSKHFEHNIASVLQDEIRCVIKKIKTLRNDVRQPRTHKRKNLERKQDIKKLLYHARDIKRYLKEHNNNQVIKIPKQTFRTIVTDAIKIRDKRMITNINRLKKYFRKSNGKIDINGMADLLHCRGSYANIPTSIDKLVLLLGKQIIKPCLVYRFAQDTNDMLPSIDTIEYRQLQSMIKRWETPGNTLLLDKIHTYLINKQNKKTYEPSEPTPLPVLPVLQSIKHDKLRLITTDRELKAEGRRQSHCIGSRQYIDLCKRGYQALNFRDYTFLLTPDLTISQTNGSHNRSTPEDIVAELQSLLSTTK